VDSHSSSEAEVAMNKFATKFPNHSFRERKGAGKKTPGGAGTHTEGYR
jgi:hypothetical protein